MVCRLTKHPFLTMMHQFGHVHLSTSNTTTAKLNGPKIGEVAIDMWEPYSDVCEELLPNADITVDRFHVAKAVNEELKKLKNQEKQQHPEVMKGAHYPLLKNQEDLTSTQQEKLDQVYETCPTLKMAHRLKECLLCSLE